MSENLKEDIDIKLARLYTVSLYIFQLLNREPLLKMDNQTRFKTT